MTDKVRYLQKTITVSTALPMPHTAGSTTTQRLYLKSSKTSAVNRAARPKTGAGSTSRPEKLHSVFTEQSHAGRATLRFPPASLRKASRSLAIFNSIFFLSSGSRTTATSLLLAPLLGLLDGESRWDWAKQTQTRS